MADVDSFHEDVFIVTDQHRCICVSVCVSRADEATCEFVLGWETRTACAVKQQEVEMVNGTIRVPDTGVDLNLGALYFRYQSPPGTRPGPLKCLRLLPFPSSHHQASGDIRPNGDQYVYLIQLSGITNSSIPMCVGANICQVKVNGPYRRRIGSSSNAKYYVKGQWTETRREAPPRPPINRPCSSFRQGGTWTWPCRPSPSVDAREPKPCRPSSCSTVARPPASASPSLSWRRTSASICSCGTRRPCVA